jgi:hypothetical protein
VIRPGSTTVAENLRRAQASRMACSTAASVMRVPSLSARHFLVDELLQGSLASAAGAVANRPTARRDCQGQASKTWLPNYARPRAPRNDSQRGLCTDSPEIPPHPELRKAVRVIAHMPKERSAASHLPWRWRICRCRSRVPTLSQRPVGRRRLAYRLARTGRARTRSRHTREAVVQVYSARAVSWRGWFGVHTWIAVKPPARRNSPSTRSWAAAQAHRHRGRWRATARRTILVPATGPSC